MLTKPMKTGGRFGRKGQYSLQRPLFSGQLLWGPPCSPDSLSKMRPQAIRIDHGDQ